MRLTTSEIIHKFDEVFKNHDASDLPAIVADDCVLEKQGQHQMAQHI